MKRIVCLSLLVMAAAGGVQAPSPASVAVASQAVAPTLHRRIVVIGDSVARGAGDESRMDGVAGRLGAVNAGINGARTWNVTALLGQRSMKGILAEADSVVLSIGGNDLYGDTPARILSALAPGLAMRLTMTRVASIVSTLERANPRLRVYLLGLYDPYRRRDLDVAVADWNAMLLSRFASDTRVSIVAIADLFRRADRLSPIDHFHPSADAYARIARRIADDF